MKLNPDCIRDILLDLEEFCTGQNRALYKANEPLEFDGRKYEFDELYYHLRQCDMMGMFVSSNTDMGRNYSINDITPRAHEFLANIRSDNVWNGVKGTAAKVGSKSLSALLQIASTVVSTIIKAEFGLA